MVWNRMRLLRGCTRGRGRWLLPQGGKLVSERDEEVLRRWGTKDPVQEGWYTRSKRRHRSGTGIGQSLMRIWCRALHALLSLWVGDGAKRGGYLVRRRWDEGRWW